MGVSLHLYCFHKIFKIWTCYNVTQTFFFKQIQGNEEKWCNIIIVPIFVVVTMKSSSFVNYQLKMFCQKPSNASPY